MGYIVPGICQPRQVGSPTQKAVLMALASYAWDDGSGIWVAKSTLAADLEMGHRTVQDAIKALIEKKLLVAVGEREAKHGFTIEYRIDLDVVETLPLTRNLRAKPAKDGCGSRTPTAERVRETASTGAGDCADGCGSRTQLSKEPLKNLPSAQAREQEGGVSDAFFADVAQALGVDLTTAGKWWSPDRAKPQIARWLALGHSGDAIISLCRKSREANPAAPDGPKALNDLMAKSALRQTVKPASEEDQAAFWAARVISGAFVPSNAFSPRIADRMLALGLVTKDQISDLGLPVHQRA